MSRKCVVLRAIGDSHTDSPFSGGAASFGIGPVAKSADVPEPRLDVVELGSREVRELHRDPEVKAIAPAMPLRLVRPLAADGVAFEPAGDARETWGVAAVQANRTGFDGDGVVVSVLDTGIDAGHPAFAGAEIIQRDFSGSGNGDRNGHGTHCAGTILGRDVDGMRIGVAPGVKQALIGKVLSDDGGGSSEMLFNAIHWAIESGAQVVSMSLGFDFPGMVAQLVQGGWPADLATSAALEAYRGNLRMFDALMDLLRARAAFDSGAVVVAAAGNESQRQIDPQYEIAVSLPAAALGVISVGALGKGAGGLSVASFSNTLPEISAPGVAVLSARTGGGLERLSGTSMAAPHVAGLAALWWQAVRSSPIPATARNVVARLLAAARTDVFAPEVEVADRGAGLATAPV